MGRFDKEAVRLRKKPLKNGGFSLYLDTYLDGVRRYEFLHLYLKEEATHADRLENNRTLQLAQAIKGKRLVEFQNNAFGFMNATAVENADFLTYIETMAAKHSPKSSNMTHCALKKLREYTRRESVPFKMIDRAFCVGFVDFLRSYKSHGFLDKQFKVARRLSDNHICNMFSVLAANLKRAYKDGLIKEDPVSKMHSDDLPRRSKVERDFLSEEEVRKLYATPVVGQVKPCLGEVVKLMFLFGCTTGLRYSDIITLRWEHLAEKDGVVYLKKKQEKTQSIVEFPLSTAAAKLLPVRPNKATGLVFGKPVHKTSVIRWLDKWVEDAGIGRHITFHMSRHTFATLMLTKGADLYVVSKLLGHATITSTQIYAKVVDDSKRNALKLMPDFQI